MPRPDRKRRPGRPSLMETAPSDPDEAGYVAKKLCEQVTKLCMLGLTDERVAAIMGLNTETYYRWQKEFPEFSKAVSEGKEHADAEVVHGLYHRAIGYSHPEEKIFYDAKAGEVVRADTTKHYPPEPVAAVFWLKNRQRHLWRDVKASEISGPDGRMLEIQQNHVVVGRQLDQDERLKLREALGVSVTDVEDLNSEEAEDDEDE